MFIDKYTSHYEPLLKNRPNCFKQIFQYLLSLDKQQYYIVETGTARHNDARLYEDGGSTFMYDDFVNTHGGSFISIDIDPKKKNLCCDKVSHNTRLITQDSIEALAGIMINNSVPHIDLLYLDSYDIDWHNSHPSAHHHLQELLAIVPKLIPGSLVVVDDNKNGIGKGQYIEKYMTEHNKKLLFYDYQIGWIW